MIARDSSSTSIALRNLRLTRAYEPSAAPVAVRDR